MAAQSDVQPSPSNTADNLPLVIIKPETGWVPLNLTELWEYRELLYFFIWRDMKVRYKQTMLGFAWAILRPIITMVVFSIVFGSVIKVASEGVPYPIFNFTALLPWTLFQGGLGRSANSILSETALIKKVYFPRLIPPIAGVTAGLPDFLISFALLLIMMVYYDIYPVGVRFLILPFLLALALAAALGVGLWLSAINVRYRDIRHIVPFLVQFWMYATPVVYPSSLLSEPWRTVYGLNPMVGVVEGFRWALIGTGQAPGPILILSSAVTLAILVSGAYFFRRMERIFADLS